MDFRILGPLEVLDDGRSLALAGTKPRALLALLLLHANETLTTDRLIDALWGEHPPAGAAKTLQMHISRLRKALAGSDGSGRDSPIVTRERGYELALDPEQLDSHRFERLLARGRAELAGDRADSAVRAFEEALALWRGDPLADLAYEPFALPEIARLDDLRSATLEQLMEAKLALGGHAEVVEQLEVLIGEHPYRERLRAQLMLALYRSDRQADALQAYQDARRTLVGELGIEPGERLRELEQAVLAQDPALAWPTLKAVEVAPVPDAGPRRAFVGRAGELAELVAGLDGAFDGHGRLLLLAGEPGIGKSRLAEALLKHARARGAAVLVGRCWEAGGAPAYWPWIQALRVYIGDTGSEQLRGQLGAGAADLVQLLPELRERFPELPEPAPLEGEGARFRLFEAVRSFLVSAADARPLVVVLDDVHAADEPSLLLLQFVARGLDASRLLVVAAYRDVDPTLRDALTAALAELVREAHTTHLALTGLTPASVAEYVQLTTGIEPGPGLVDAIHAETEGNPLFVAEVVHLLAADGRVEEADAPMRIPPGVRAVIGRRVARLSARCQALLLSASVIGREFGLDSLAALSELEPDELMDVLNEAMAERVLDDVPGAPGRARFGHALDQGHALRRVDGGPADAAPQGGRRGARGRLLIRSGAASRRTRAALRGRRPPWRGRQGDRVRAPRGRQSRRPACVRGGGAPVRDRADARRRPARALRAAARARRRPRAGGQFGALRSKRFGKLRSSRSAAGSPSSWRAPRLATGEGSRGSGRARTRASCRCWSVPSRRSKSETVPRG